jgi:hypothetical protein
MRKESILKCVLGEIFSGVALLVGEGACYCTLHGSRTEKKKKKLDAGLRNNER